MTQLLEIYIYFFNPNTIKSYKISQKLSPKHAAHGVAQSAYPNYRHGKACLSKQPPWRAAGDPRLARGRSRVRAPGPAGALRAFFLRPPFLPPSGDSFFRTFPTNPAKVLGLLYTTSMVYNNPNTIKSYKISQKLSPKHAAHGVAQSAYPNYRHGKACLSKQPPWRAVGDPRLARGRSRVRAPGPAGTLRTLFFSTLPSFLLPEIVFFAPSPPTPQKC